MVAVAALVVATGERAVGVVHIGSGLGEQEILAEDVRGTELVGAGGGIHQTAGDNDVVEHLPAVAVGVGAQAVTEELPHRIVEVGAGEFLGFRLGAHLLHDALGGRVVVEVAHVDEFGVWTGVQHGIGDATAQLAGGHTPRKAALLTARFGRPVVNHNVKRVNTIQNAGHQPLVAGDEIGVVGHNRRESPRAENLETGSIIEESHVDTAAIRRLVMAYRQMVGGQEFRFMIGICISSRTSSIKFIP